MMNFGGWLNNRYSLKQQISAASKSAVLNSCMLQCPCIEDDKCGWQAALIIIASCKQKLEEPSCSCSIAAKCTLRTLQQSAPAARGGCLQPCEIPRDRTVPEGKELHI